jgi:hypothetical protein
LNALLASWRNNSLFSCTFLILSNSAVQSRSLVHESLKTHPFTFSLDYLSL